MKEGYKQQIQKKAQEAVSEKIKMIKINAEFFAEGELMKGESKNMIKEASLEETYASIDDLVIGYYDGIDPKGNYTGEIYDENDTPLNYREKLDFVYNIGYLDGYIYRAIVDRLDELEKKGDLKNQLH